MYGGSPCISYADTAGAAVSCWLDGSWSTTRPPGASHEEIVGLVIDRSRLIALTRSANGGVVWTYAFESRRWAAAAAPLTTSGALVAVRAGTAGPHLLKRAMTHGAPITVYALSRSRWRPVGPPLPTGSPGPVLDGPVEVGSSIAVPVVNARGAKWEFRAAVLRGKRWHRGPRLDSKTGTVQGTLTALDGQLVALWLQDGRFNGTALKASAFVAPLSARTGAPRRTTSLWSERDIGPGSLHVVRAGRTIWLLSLRANPQRPATLRAVIQPVDLGAILRP
jgi:hypothetical protein